MADICNGCGNDREPALLDADDVRAARKIADRRRTEPTCTNWEAGYNAGVQQALSWVLKENAAHPYPTGE